MNAQLGALWRRARIATSRTAWATIAIAGKRRPLLQANTITALGCCRVGQPEPWAT